MGRTSRYLSWGPAVVDNDLWVQAIAKAMGRSEWKDWSGSSAGGSLRETFMEFRFGVVGPGEVLVADFWHLLVFMTDF